MSTQTYPYKRIFRLLLFLAFLNAGQAAIAQKIGSDIKVRKPAVSDIKKPGKGSTSGSQQNTPNNSGNNPQNSNEKKDSGLVECDKFFVANGIDGEYKTAEDACKAFGKVKFPGYTLVKCTTAFNGSVYYKFTKGSQIAEQQGQIWFKIRCPESAYQLSTDGTDNWQKQECACYKGYHPEGKLCIKDTIKTCLGEMIEKYGSHKATLIRLYKECILWDSVCSLFRSGKIDNEKFLTAAEKKTSKQDTNALLWKRFSHVDTAIVISWEVVNKATAQKQSSGLTSDFPLLASVRDIKYQGAYKAIGGDAGMAKLIEANKRANCKSCDIVGAPYLSPIDEYLADVNYFVVYYQNDKVLATAKQISSSGKPNQTVEGTAFQFRILHNYQNAIIGDSVVFEGSIDDADNEADNEDHSLCKFDMRTGWNGNYHFYEFKSLKPGSHFNEKQLLTYLKNIESHSDLTYIFDGKKISQDQAVKKLVNVLVAQFDSWYPQLPPEKWAQLFNTTPNKDDIKAAVSNTENIFYYRVVKVYP
jgi:hypothetical protein